MQREPLLECMRYAVNLLLFSDVVDASVLEAFPLIRDCGYDAVEVPIFAPESLRVDAIRAQAQACGLAVSASGAPPPGSRLYGEDRAAREAGLAYLRGAIAAAAELGGNVLCGPLAKPVGDHDLSAPLDAQRAESARALADVSAEAEARGVRLAFEPLNRFETGLLNTAGQGLAFCEAIGSAGAGLLLDTFHMHIEEKDPAAAIAGSAQSGRLFHFHASENDRGIPGTGQVAWPSVAQALRASGYEGWVVLESFSQKNEAIKTAVSCWRPFFESEEAFLREGLAFVKRQFEGETVS
jgi:D-psicose/D-tagatose/L-ribulose 3-epimerase